MRLRLATFNLESLDDAPDAAMPLDRRIPVLRRALARLDADVICLQEVNAQKRGGEERAFHALDRLVEDTPLATFHRAATVGDSGAGPRDVHNLVVLSRLPIAASEQVAHSLVPPVAWPWLSPDTGSGPVSASIRFDRPILHVRVDLGPAGPLHVVNLHLRAPIASPVPGQKQSASRWRTTAGWAEGYFLAALKRTAQALEARLVVDRLLDGDPAALIAVVGDFNAEGREVPLSILRADLEHTGNDALAGRSLVSLDRHLPADSRFTVRHGGRPLMLDHVMVSHPLARRCRAVQVFNEELADELAAFRAGIVDPAGFHAPLVATFELA